jgi:hypothetical protein
MHSAHIASWLASWIELMGANLEVGRKVGAVRHFSISSFASSLLR